ncbi:DgyrCDS11524 [Dimorphilus gyrociliatus]|uniref:DgyrCDS11524 n=1 Tax=Dimorphilus gyrociliatus TaxID=2664684 RepID=A0A7I8W3M9_9ANNE|nr:DgyrCDS11524 [Dimorphilus gyrociliatus]
MAEKIKIDSKNEKTDEETPLMTSSEVLKNTLRSLAAKSAPKFAILSKLFPGAFKKKFDQLEEIWNDSTNDYNKDVEETIHRLLNDPQCSDGKSFLDLVNDREKLVEACLQKETTGDGKPLNHSRIDLNAFEISALNDKKKSLEDALKREKDELERKVKETEDIHKQLDSVSSELLQNCLV